MAEKTRVTTDERGPEVCSFSPKSASPCLQEARQAAADDPTTKWAGNCGCTCLCPNPPPN